MATASKMNGHWTDSPGAAGGLVIVALIVLIVLGRLAVNVHVG